MAPAAFWSILLLPGAPRALRSLLCRFCLSWRWLLLTCLFLPVYLLALSADVTKTQRHISRMLGAAERAAKVNSSIQNVSNGCRERGGKGVFVWDLGQPELSSNLLRLPCSLQKAGSPQVSHSCTLSSLPSIVQEVELMDPKESMCLEAEIQHVKLEDTADLYCDSKIKNVNPKCCNLGCHTFFSNLLFFQQTDLT